MIRIIRRWYRGGQNKEKETHAHEIVFVLENGEKIEVGFDKEQNCLKVSGDNVRLRLEPRASNSVWIHPHR